MSDDEKGKTENVTLKSDAKIKISEKESGFDVDAIKDFSEINK